LDKTVSAGRALGGTSLKDPLLTTKLYVPTVKPNHVERRRLTELLNGGAKGRLTLISAPAGFGKTTLLSEWSLQSELPIAWVSLDEGDNNLGRFLAYLVAALGTLREGFGEGILDPLHSPEPPPIAYIPQVVGMS
jgi:LuxR family maltose regulon positive regulatory protein